MARTISIALATVSLALLPMLPAQREQKVMKAKSGQAAISYTAVTVGTHGLHELQVGRNWNMGEGSMVTTVPLISGNNVIAPGTYVAQIFRAAERDLRLSLGGGGFGAMMRGGRGGQPGRGRGGRGGQGGGGTGTGTGTGVQPRRGGEGSGRGSGNQMKGELSKPKKTTKKLTINWVGAAKKATGKDKVAGVKDAALKIDFGRQGLFVPVQLVQAKSKAVKNFQSLGFTYPLSVFTKHQEWGNALAVLTLVPRAKRRKNAPLVGFNVMVGSDSATVVPLPKAAAGGRGGRRGAGGRGGDGRGGRGNPQPDADTAEPKLGSVAWSSHQNTNTETVEIKSIKVRKNMLEFEIVAGTKIGKVSVPLPTLPKK
jgi:hypothetical protein